MKLKDVYKIADSKEFYTKKELLETALKTSSTVSAKKFKENILKNNVSKKITLLFPIYNEESFLDYSLESFFNSFMYPNTSYQIIFFLNSCTDNSPNKTKEILERYKKLERKFFSEEEFKKLNDPNLDCSFLYLKDRSSYYILNTKTKGRVNALKVANNMARINGSQVLMSFDTDFILEPPAIYFLSREAIKNITLEKDTVVMTGSPIIVNNKKYTKLQKWLRSHFVWEGQKYNSLSGCCLILEPNWLYENIEENIIEDYTLGVKARYQNYQVKRVDDARMWGYRTDYKDDIQQLSRSIKGRYQLLEKHPEFSDIIFNDHFFMQKFTKRCSYILKSLCVNPSQTAKWVWTFIFTELAIVRAKISYKRNPQKIDWEPLNSAR